MNGLVGLAALWWVYSLCVSVSGAGPDKHIALPCPALCGLADSAVDINRQPLRLQLSQLMLYGEVLL